MTFHSVGNVVIPTDELTPSFFRGVAKNHQPVMKIIREIQYSYDFQLLLTYPSCIYLNISYDDARISLFLGENPPG